MFGPEDAGISSSSACRQNLKFPGHQNCPVPVVLCLWTQVQPVRTLKTIYCSCIQHSAAAADVTHPCLFSHQADIYVQPFCGQMLELVSPFNKGHSFAEGSRQIQPDKA